jgi:hypothetical protein
MSDEIQTAEPGEAKQPGLAHKPIRALLVKTIEDRNVAVGDEAFMALAQLNFQVRENVGTCIFSSPSPETSEQFLSGSRNGKAACVRRNVCTPTASCFTLIVKTFYFFAFFDCSSSTTA